MKLFDGQDEGSMTISVVVLFLFSNSYMGEADL